MKVETLEPPVEVQVPTVEQAAVVDPAPAIEVQEPTVEAQTYDVPSAVVELYDPMAPRGERVRKMGKSMLHALGKTAMFTGRWGARVGLPLAGAWTMLHVPYHTTVQDIPIRVQGSMLSRPGFTADSSFGNWEFDNVDALPLGVHVSPVNVDALQVARAANPDVDAYTAKLEKDFKAKATEMEVFLALELLLGIGGGALAGAGINYTRRYFKEMPKREHEVEYRAKQALAIAAAVAVLAGIGAETWNPDWAKDSKLTGTLAEAQGLKGNLADYYTTDNKLYQETQSYIDIQKSLQKKVEGINEPTAYNVMLISDMHLSNGYDTVMQYAKMYNVKLIINTGDEGETGLPREMTPEYIDKIREITKTIPMIWIAGNHDSPETIEVMRSIPGVIVLGGKEEEPDGTFSVSAQRVNIFGEEIGGVPSVRVYNAAGKYGSPDDSVTNPLEVAAADSALKGAVDQKVFYDFFGTHTTAMKDEVLKLLKGYIGQVDYGHTHVQNSSKDVVSGPVLNFREGSTGGGGLDHFFKPSPTQFSIESISGTCQKTLAFRYSIENNGTGQDITLHRIELPHQNIGVDRHCSIDMGVGAVQDILTGFDAEEQPIPAKG